MNHLNLFKPWLRPDLISAVISYSMLIYRVENYVYPLPPQPNPSIQHSEGSHCMFKDSMCNPQKSNSLNAVTGKSILTPELLCLKSISSSQMYSDFRVNMHISTGVVGECRGYGPLQNHFFRCNSNFHTLL